MKQQLNEVQKLQKIAGILKESQLKKADIKADFKKTKTEVKDLYTHIHMFSDPASNGKILKLVRTIDPNASFAGGIGGGGDRALIAKGNPNDYKKLLSQYINRGIVTTISKF